MKKAPKIDAETIKNGVGNWVLFFVRLEGWKLEAWGVAGGPWGEGMRGIDESDDGFWPAGGRGKGWGVGYWL